jgi:hypothetical protein
MLIAIHVRAATFTLTSVAFETYIIPQPGSFLVTPTAIATTIDIGQRKTYRKGTVL